MGDREIDEKLRQAIIECSEEKMSKESLYNIIERALCMRRESYNDMQVDNDDGDDEGFILCEERDAYVDIYEIVVNSHEYAFVQE